AIPRRGPRSHWRPSTYSLLSSWSPYSWGEATGRCTIDSLGLASISLPTQHGIEHDPAHRRLMALAVDLRRPNLRTRAPEKRMGCLISVSYRSDAKRSASQAERVSQHALDFGSLHVGRTVKRDESRFYRRPEAIRAAIVHYRLAARRTLSVPDQ